ncbi:hypothetical protein L3X38_040424 [Prunus dulcis]|uniref:Uncharacterized protein n=1 Tax=Prunus dulcis TaxID=3755 RepID=A0AAD4VB87_PRUDU|nr:hypothetical protein L3X38_040424 [Prunus dulcis]
MMSGSGSSTSSAHDDLFILLLGAGVGRVACCAQRQSHLVSSESEAEGDLLVSTGAVYDAHVLCFYWANRLGACQASTNSMLFTTTDDNIIETKGKM